MQFWACVLVVICVCLPVGAIVLHPEHEPQAWPDGLAGESTGRWSHNASFVVIGPEWLITARHQRTSPESVVIGGKRYLCSYDRRWEGGPDGRADFRLVRLSTEQGRPARLEHWVKLNDELDEAGRLVYITGYGQGAGQVVSSWGRTLGYEWDGGSNNTLRFCTNTIVGAEPNSVAGNWRSDVLTARFEEPGSTKYEGAPAMYDSGGGWFIESQGQWRLAGISRTVSRIGQSYFRPPDRFDAVRISAYAQWIEWIMQEHPGTEHALGPEGF